MQTEESNTTADSGANTRDVVTTVRRGPHREEDFLDD
jgi:hypothetical protein